MKKSDPKLPKSGPKLRHVDRLEREIAIHIRTEFAQTHLERLRGTFETLLADENFLTLLRAESIDTVPYYLKRTMGGKANNVPRNFRTQDRGDNHSKRDRTQKVSLIRLPSKPLNSVALDQLTLTI